MAAGRLPFAARERRGQHVGHALRGDAPQRDFDVGEPLVFVVLEHSETHDLA